MKRIPRERQVSRLKTTYWTALKQKSRHAAAALLLAVGLLAPVLATLGLIGHLGTGAVAAIMLAAAMLLVSPLRIGKIIFYGGMTAAFVLWLMLLGGMTTLTETLKAMLYQYAGFVTAGMYAQEITCLLAVVCALLCWALTRDDMGVLPAVFVVAGVSILLWASGCDHMAITLTPAVLAVLLLSSDRTQSGTPLRRVLPMALVLALISGLATLGGGVEWEPLSRTADELRERIEDYLFFTEPRNVFSLSAEGYYPQGQNQLGGPAQPRDHLVMVVETPRRTYLRGSVRNEYTGRAWYDTTGGRRYLWVSPRWDAERAAAFDMALPAEIIRQNSSFFTPRTVTVRMTDTSASTLFVPQRIMTLSTGGDMVAYFNRGSELFITRDLAPGDIYTVTAAAPLAGDAGLDTIISASAANDDPQYAAMQAGYTILPGHMQDMVWDLVREITAGAETPYEKALAIQQYLSTNYTYTLDAAPQPENIDFVTNFLFNTKEGYCTYFASAMTVMCRMAGLPARYVEGYLAEPDGTGVAYVTGRNGHAWTEVYFAGFGWLTFDATPPRDDPNSLDGNAPQLPDESETPPTDPPADESTPTPSPEPSDEPTDSPDPSGGEPPTPTPAPEQPEGADAATPTPAPESPNGEPDGDQPAEAAAPPAWLWLLLLLLLLTAALYLRIRMTMPQRLAARAKTEEDVHIVWVQAVYDALLVMKLPAVKSESPIAYAARLDASGRLPVRMKPIGRQLSAVFYGKLIPDEGDLASLQNAWRVLNAQLRPHERILLCLRRAFMPLKRRSYTARG